MTGICQFFERLFFMRPSNIEENLKLYTLHTKTFFSIYPKTVRNIQCTPKTDRNETLWHMTKNETSLKSSSPQKKIRPGFYWFLSYPVLLHFNFKLFITALRYEYFPWISILNYFISHYGTQKVIIKSQIMFKLCLMAEICRK